MSKKKNRYPRIRHMHRHHSLSNMPASLISTNSTPCPETATNNAKTSSTNQNGNVPFKIRPPYNPRHDPAFSEAKRQAIRLTASRDTKFSSRTSDTEVNSETPAIELEARATSKNKQTFSEKDDPVLLAAKQQAVRLRDIGHPEFSSRTLDTKVDETLPTLSPQKHTATGDKKRKRSTDEHRYNDELQEESSDAETGSSKSYARRQKKLKRKEAKRHLKENKQMQPDVRCTIPEQSTGRFQDVENHAHEAVTPTDAEVSHQFTSLCGNNHPSKQPTSVVRSLKPSLEAVRSADRDKDTKDQWVALTSTDSDSESISSYSSTSASSDEAETPSRTSAASRSSSTISSPKTHVAFQLKDVASDNAKTAKPAAHATSLAKEAAYWQAVSDLKRIIPPQTLEAAATHIKKSENSESDASTDIIENFTIICLAARNLIVQLSSCELTGKPPTLSQACHDGNAPSLSSASYASRSIHGSQMEQQLTRIASDQAKRLESLELENMRLRTDRK